LIPFASGARKMHPFASTRVPMIMAAGQASVSSASRGRKIPSGAAACPTPHAENQIRPV